MPAIVETFDKSHELTEANEFRVVFAKTLFIVPTLVVSHDDRFIAGEGLVFAKVLSRAVTLSVTVHKLTPYKSAFVIPAKVLDRSPTFCTFQEAKGGSAEDAPSKVEAKLVTLSVIQEAEFVKNRSADTQSRKVPSKVTTFAVFQAVRSEFISEQPSNAFARVVTCETSHPDPLKL
jgi:hypothetical protein